MLEINEVQQYRTDAQGLAERFLNDYASDHEVSYPINPFQILISDSNEPWHRFCF